jgi:archaellum component FlaF (FlaF/FlaG flagellin family)
MGNDLKHIKKYDLLRAETITKNIGDKVDKFISPNRFQVGVESVLTPGGVIFGNLSVSGSCLVEKFVNFGKRTGDSGFGFRVNSSTGKIQYRSDPSFGQATSWADISAGSGGTPGGSDTQVQFNDGGSSFGGDSSFIFNKTSDSLTVSNISGSLTRLSNGTSYLIAGNNVTITSASSGGITIGSLASISREKNVQTLTSGVSAGSALTVSGIDFSSVGYAPSSIDVYVNGQMIHSGTNEDYILTANQTNQITFAFDLDADDVVTTILFLV